MGGATEHARRLHAGTPGVGKFQVAGGKIARIPSNELGYAGADALPPQSLLSDARKEEYWLAPIQ